ncbi:MAG: hypothetical protein HFACDABA_01172 [Anaerolineales bacterium]|nr:hypothetical protein [Anaerolineales bacterium]
MESRGKFKIKGKKMPGYDTEIEVDLGDQHAEHYEVTDKPIPDPTPYEKGTITWFVAFAVREKSNGAYADIPYTVTLNKLPKGKTKLFALLPTGIMQLKAKAGGSGKIKVELAVGDPPMGFYP